MNSVCGKIEITHAHCFPSVYVVWVLLWHNGTFLKLLLISTWAGGTPGWKEIVVLAWERHPPILRKMEQNVSPASWTKSCPILCSDTEVWVSLLISRREVFIFFQPDQWDEKDNFFLRNIFFKKSIIPLIIFVQLICASKYISGRNVWLCCSIATWMITLSSTASTYSKCSVHRIWLPLWSPVLLFKRSEWHKRFTVISQGKVR